MGMAAPQSVVASLCLMGAVVQCSSELDGRSLAAAEHATNALDYLRTEMDVYHYRTVVYDDVESGGARFVPSGWMKGPDGDWSSADVEQFKLEHSQYWPVRGATCLRAEWRPATDLDWVGVYFQYPEDNWGRYRGLDLSGATTLTFWARSDYEAVAEFIFAGIDCSETEEGQPAPDFDCAFRDSSDKVSTGSIILTPCWRQYSIDLTEKAGHHRRQLRDLSNVIGGFAFVVTSLANPPVCNVWIDRIEINHARVHEPRLIRSFHAGTDPLHDKGSGAGVYHLRNFAAVYDNAMAICAFLASGNPRDHERARVIANAFVQLAAFERRSCDSDPACEAPGVRLRNAYMCGDLFNWQVERNRVFYSSRTPGWIERDESAEAVPIQNSRWLEDQYAKGTHTGNIAWAILALLNFWAADGADPNSPYLKTSRELGNWIIEHCSDAPPHGIGFSGGFEWDDAQVNALGRRGREVAQTWKSTEHNIDLAIVFYRLAQACRRSPNLSSEAMQWEAAAIAAFSFVEWAIQEEEERPWLVTGTDPRGQAAHDVRPLDPQTWSVLAFRRSVFPDIGAVIDDFDVSLNWAIQSCVQDGRTPGCRVCRNGVTGFTYRAPKPEEGQSCQIDVGFDIWPEGTAQVVQALRVWESEGRVGSVSSGAVLTSLEVIQSTGGKPAQAHGALPAAYPSFVDTGFLVTEHPKKIKRAYFDLPALAATAWYITAKLDYNPFWGTPLGLEHEWMGTFDESTAIRLRTFSDRNTDRPNHPIQFGTGPPRSKPLAGPQLLE